jgi:hypothetical protein
MVLPLVLLALTVVVQAGLLAADVVHVQGLAREAARAAAVGDDAAARAVTERAAGARPVRVRLDPPGGVRAAGDHVTAVVELESSAFGRLGPPVRLVGEATMRVEQP